MGGNKDHENATPLPPPSESFAALMLVVACLCWALSFSLTKNWHNAARGCPGGALVGGLTLMALRSGLGLLLLAAVQPHLFRRPSRREHRIGLLLGLVNWTGFAMQVYALASITPALSGFFTSLASAWIPVLAFVCFRLPVSRPTLIGLGLGITGVAVLSFDFGDLFSDGESPALKAGDALSLAASVIFAVTVLLLDRLGRTVKSSHLTVSFIAITGLASLLLVLGLVAAGPGPGAWLSWLLAMLREPAVVLDVVLLTLFPTVLATYCLTTFQPRVSAGRAALIYLLEPPLAAIVSLVLGHDSLTARLVVGGALIVGGNLLVEMRVWWKAWENGPRFGGAPD
jgi:drug/metabolite transporter (DMT)-like permease